MKPTKPVPRLGAAAAIATVVLLAAPAAAHAQEKNGNTFDDETLELRAVVEALRREVTALREIRRGQKKPLRIATYDAVAALESYERGKAFLKVLELERARAKEGGARARARYRLYRAHLTRQLLADARKQAQEIARAEGYDLLFEAAPPGGTPVDDPGRVRVGGLLEYPGEHDITERVTAALNASENASRPPRTLEEMSPLLDQLDDPGAPAEDVEEEPGERPHHDARLRHVMEQVLPPLIEKARLTTTLSKDGGKSWQQEQLEPRFGEYIDDPARIRERLAGLIDHYVTPIVPLVESGEVVALGLLGAATADAWSLGTATPVVIVGLELADAARWPRGAVRDIAPFRMMVAGRRWLLFVGAADEQVEPVRRALEDTFGSVVSAAAYEAETHRLVTGDAGGEIVDGGFRIDRLPAKDGFFAQWLGGLPDLRAGDVVRSINGVQIDADTSPVGLYTRFKYTEAFELIVRRDAKELTVRFDVWPPASLGKLLDRLAAVLPDGLGARERTSPTKMSIAGDLKLFLSNDAHRRALLDRWKVGQDGGELDLLAVEMKNAGEVPDRVARLASVAPFRDVFVGSRYVVAIRADWKARQDPRVARFVAEVERLFVGHGGRRVPLPVVDDTPKPPAPKAEKKPEPEKPKHGPLFDQGLLRVMEQVKTGLVPQLPYDNYGMDLTAETHADEPAKMALFLSCLPSASWREVLQPVFDRDQAVAMAAVDVHYGNEKATAWGSNTVSIVAVETLGPWPLGAVRDIGSFDYVVLGAHWALFIELFDTSTYNRSKQAESIQKFFAPERVLTAGEYEETVVSALTADMKAEISAEGLRVFETPSSQGFLAQWLGRESGLRAGDLVTHIGGVRMDESISARALIKRFDAMTGLDARVVRAGESLELRTPIWPPATGALLLDAVASWLPDDLPWKPVDGVELGYEHIGWLPLQVSEEYSLGRALWFLNGWKPALDSKRITRAWVRRHVFVDRKGEVTVLVIDYPSVAVRQEMFGKVSAARGFDWVVGAGDYIIAIGGDDVAQARAGYHAFAARLLETVAETGGEVLIEPPSWKKTLFEVRAIELDLDPLIEEATRHDAAGDTKARDAVYVRMAPLIERGRALLAQAREAGMPLDEVTRRDAWLSADSQAVLDEVAENRAREAKKAGSGKKD